MAQSKAMDSLLAGIRYGWRYKGVNKSMVVVEGLGLIVVPATGGYVIGDQLFNE